MPTDNDKDDPNKQGTGRLKDGLDAAGKLRPGAHIWWDRDYLPHVESTDLVQHVCFRLEDSLPRQVVQQMEAELMSLPPSLRSPEQEKRVNAYLDAGHGSCILRDPFIAELIDSTLLHFHGDRYTLYAWCIMPNHVHALVTPAPTITLSALLHTWKSFSAKQANRVLGRSGAFWMQEYFDRYIRDEDHFVSAVEYIHNNPVAAGLCASPPDWPFSSATRS